MENHFVCFIMKFDYENFRGFLVLGLYFLSFLDYEIFFVPPTYGLRPIISGLKIRVSSQSTYTNESYFQRLVIVFL